MPSRPWLMLWICSLSVLVLHEILLVPLLRYGNETMLWKKKERSRVKAIQMDNLRGLLGIRRMDGIPNARIRELCGVRKRPDERIDEGVLSWFGHVERMERDMITKRVYVGELLEVVQWVGHGRDGLIP